MEWLRAGAEIICTATYQVTTDMLATEFSISADEAEAHIRQHCRDMCDVANQHWASTTTKSTTAAGAEMDIDTLEHGVRCGNTLSRSDDNANAGAVEHAHGHAHGQYHGQGRRPLVALSLGPFSAISPDYNEFSSDYDESITRAVLADFHACRLVSFLPPSSQQPQSKAVTSLSSPSDEAEDQAQGEDLTNTVPHSQNVAVVAFETVGTTMEALAAIDAMRTHCPNLPFWISFQCKDGSSIANGEALTDAVREVLAAHPTNLVAIGVNCVCITLTAQLTRLVRDEIDRFAEKTKNTNKTLNKNHKVGVLAYPNSGEVWCDRSWVWRKGDNKMQAPLVEDDWASTVMQSGATIVGGCCRTGPEHISALRRAALSLK